MIKVLIVDDSAVFRSQIRASLAGAEGVEVVGFASNGRLAIEVMKTKQIDVVTLDLEMPEMDGLTTLAEMKRLNLSPRVIVFSAFSQAGAQTTMKALQAGAMDFCAKPILAPGETDPAAVIRRDLLPKIRQFSVGAAPVAATPSASSTLIHATQTAAQMPAVNWRAFSPSALVIASSTGGPTALENLFSMLRPPFRVPILITQHMPPVFTATLADRLSKLCGAPVAEGKDGELIKAGHVYIAPGNFHMSIAGVQESPRIRLDQGEQRNYVRPAADFLFESAATVYKNACLGMVLTGMGSDGLDGAIAIKKRSGAILIQNRETCTVFGMPGAVFSAGAYDLMGDIPTLAKKILSLNICSSLNTEGANVA